MKRNIYKLSLSPNYVSEWTPSDAIRELTQNALDNSEELDYTWLQGDEGWKLTITTPNVELPPSLLLLGGSDITHYRLAVKEERQTGRTTEQIKNAPKGSYYVTRDFKHTNYITELCIPLSRTDIKIVSNRWLDAMFRGTEHTATVIIDHAVELTLRQRENLKRFDKPYKPSADEMKWIGTFTTDKAQGTYLDNWANLYGLKREISESDDDLRSRMRFKNEVKDTFSVDNVTDSGNMDTQFKQQEEIQMTTRNLMTATLVDNDKGLEIDQSLVYSTEVMVEGDDTQTAIQELIFTDVVLGERIAEHNKKRTKTINLEVLERTGQEVFLRPKKISELTWAVK